MAAYLDNLGGPGQRRKHQQAVSDQNIAVGPVEFRRVEHDGDASHAEQQRNPQPNLVSLVEERQEHRGAGSECSFEDAQEDARDEEGAVGSRCTTTGCCDTPENHI